MSDDVIVVATWDEAKKLGARFDGINYWDSEGRLYVSVSAGPRRVEGLRVGTIRTSLAAIERRGYEDVMRVLLASQAKTAGLQ